MNSKFTIRPRPQPGESLSSYLFRLAVHNVVDYIDFFKIIYKSETWTRFRSNRIHFIDVYPDKVIDTNRLKALTNLSESDIRKMTFMPIIEKYIQDDKEVETYISMILREMEGQKRRFCPHCIKKDGYYKLIWQVKEIEICNIHLTKLQHSCKNCNGHHLYSHKYLLTCKSCLSTLSNIVVEMVDEDEYIKNQLKLYEDWKYLLSESTILSQDYSDMSKEQAIALTLLYVSQSNNNEYKSTSNKIFSKDMANRFKMFIQSSDYKKVNRPYLTYLLKVTSGPEISCTLEDFSITKVPQKFIDSVLSEYKNKDLGPCLTDWCESYETNLRMKKIDAYYMNAKHYKQASVCMDCFIHFGFSRSNNQWEEIGEKSKYISKLRYLLNEGININRLSEFCNVSPEKSYEITGILMFYKLLHKETHYKLMSKIDNIDNNVEKQFTELVNITKTYNKRTLRHKSKELFGWTILQFYYYFAHPRIQEYIIFNAKLDLAKDQIDLINKVSEQTENYLNEKKKITLSGIATDLNLVRNVIAKRRITSIIYEGQKKQIEDMNNYLWDCVKSFINKKKINENSFKYIDICEHIGYKKEFISKKYPELHNYIVREVKMERQNRNKQRRQEFCRNVIEARNYLISIGAKATLEETAKYLGVKPHKISYSLKKEKKSWNQLL